MNENHDFSVAVQPELPPCDPELFNGDWIDKPNPRHEAVDWHAVFPCLSRTTRDEVDAVIAASTASLGITKGRDGYYRLPSGCVLKHNHFTIQLDRYRYALRSGWWIQPTVSWDDIPALYQLHTLLKEAVPPVYGDINDISGGPQHYEPTRVCDGFGTGGLSDTKGT